MLGIFCAVSVLLLYAGRAAGAHKGTHCALQKTAAQLDDLLVAKQALQKGPHAVRGAVKGRWPAHVQHHNPNGLRGGSKRCGTQQV